MAVGSRQSVALAEVMSSTGTWSSKAPTTPKGTSGTQPYKVSCVTTNFCQSVGYFYNSAGVAQPMIETWNGTKWSVQTVALPVASLGSALLDVSCTSTTFCEAVGYWESSTGQEFGLGLQWNGSHWIRQSVPTPAGNANALMEGVYCTTTASCVGVGQASITSAASAAAWTFDGSSWSATAVPVPAGSTASSIAAVSCPSVGPCTAVGHYDQGSVSSVLAETWNGSAWTDTTLPMPGGETYADPASISCTSQSQCVAVGTAWSDGTSTSAFSEVLTSSGWSVSIVDPSLSWANLSGVSCTSATACTAVGQDWVSGANVALAERYDGTSWTNASAPQPVGATQSALYGVSCFQAATSCEAVGYQSFYGPDISLAEVLT
jgi:hypothetical protein